MTIDMRTIAMGLFAAVMCLEGFCARDSVKYVLASASSLDHGARSTSPFWGVRNESTQFFHVFGSAISGSNKYVSPVCGHLVPWSPTEDFFSKIAERFSRRHVGVKSRLDESFLSCLPETGIDEEHLKWLTAQLKTSKEPSELKKKLLMTMALRDLVTYAHEKKLAEIHAMLGSVGDVEEAVNEEKDMLDEILEKITLGNIGAIKEKVSASSNAFLLKMIERYFETVHATLDREIRNTIRTCCGIKRYFVAREYKQCIPSLITPRILHEVIQVCMLDTPSLPPVGSGGAQSIGSRSIGTPLTKIYIMMGLWYLQHGEETLELDLVLKRVYSAITSIQHHARARGYSPKALNVDVQKGEWRRSPHLKLQSSLLPKALRVFSGEEKCRRFSTVVPEETPSEASFASEDESSSEDQSFEDQDADESDSNKLASPSAPMSTRFFLRSLSTQSDTTEYSARNKKIMRAMRRRCPAVSQPAKNPSGSSAKPVDPAGKTNSAGPKHSKSAQDKSKGTHKKNSKSTSGNLPEALTAPSSELPAIPKSWMPSKIKPEVPLFPNAPSYRAPQIGSTFYEGGSSSHPLQSGWETQNRVPHLCYPLGPVCPKCLGVPPSLDAKPEKSVTLPAPTEPSSLDVTSLHPLMPASLSVAGINLAGETLIQNSVPRGQSPPSSSTVSPKKELSPKIYLSLKPSEPKKKKDTSSHPNTNQFSETSRIPPVPKPRTKIIDSTSNKVPLKIESLPHKDSMVPPSKLPVNTPNESPVKTPNESPVNTPNESLVNTLNELLVNTSTELPVNISNESPVDISNESPVDTSTDPPVNIPNGLPVTTSTDPSATTSTDPPVTIPNESPVTSNTPADKVTFGDKNASEVPETH